MSAKFLSLLTAASGELANGNGLYNFLAAVAEFLGSTVTSPGVSFVWRPGGTAEGNVVTTDEELFNATEAADGVVVVAVDDSLAPARITAARPFDASNILWVPFTPSGLVPRVNVLAGASVTGLGIQGIRRVQFDLNPDGAPVLVYNTPGPIILNDRALLINQGVGAAIEYLEAGNPFVAILNDGSEINTAGDPVFDLGATGRLSVFIDDFSELASETVAGTPGSILQERYTLGSRLPQTLSAFSGTLDLVRYPDPWVVQKWCSQDGDDVTGDGSLERPYRNIARALQDSPGSDMVVNLGVGEYEGLSIDTTVPRASLTIQGQSGRALNETVILPDALGDYGIDLSPTALQSGSIRSFVLRNLFINGGALGTVSVTRGAGAPSTYLESQDGLWIENCFLSSGGAAALLVGDAGVVNLRDCQFNGNVAIGSISRGAAINCQQLSGFFIFLFDPTTTGPISPPETFFFKGCSLIDLSIDGAPVVDIDSSTTGNTLFVAPNDFGTGETLELTGNPRFSTCFIEYLSTDVTTHIVRLDQAAFNEFSAFFDVTPAAGRQPISLKNGVVGEISVDAQIDLDAMDTTCQVYTAGGVGVDQGTIDRRQVLVRSNAVVGPLAVTIDPPLPVATYEVLTTLNQLPAAAISTATTPVSGSGFSHQSTAGAAGEAMSCFVTRY